MTTEQIEKIVFAAKQRTRKPDIIEYVVYGVLNKKIVVEDVYSPEINEFREDVAYAILSATPENPYVPVITMDEDGQPVADMSRYANLYCEHSSKDLSFWNCLDELGAEDMEGEDLRDLIVSLDNQCLNYIKVDDTSGYYEVTVHPDAAAMRDNMKLLYCANGHDSMESRQSVLGAVLAEIEGRAGNNFIGCHLYSSKEDIELNAKMARFVTGLDHEVVLRIPKTAADDKQDNVVRWFDKLKDKLIKAHPDIPIREMLSLAEESCVHTVDFPNGLYFRYVNVVLCPNNNEHYIDIHGEDSKLPITRTCRIEISEYSDEDEVQELLDTIKQTLKSDPPIIMETSPYLPDDMTSLTHKYCVSDWIEEAGLVDKHDAWVVWRDNIAASNTRTPDESDFTAAYIGTFKTRYSALEHVVSGGLCCGLEWLEEMPEYCYGAIDKERLAADVLFEEGFNLHQEDYTFYLFAGG